MKKILSLIFICLFCICSCNNSNKSANNKSSDKDTIYNDNIQGVFFDTPFGASKEELVKNFKKHGFYLNTYISTDALLHFSPSQGSRFTFGNMGWDILDAGMYNGKFAYIRFMAASKDKATVVNEYDKILSKVSQKYHMMEEVPSDSTIYKISTGYSRSNRIVSVSCFRYESLSRQIFQGLQLIYRDENLENAVSDEL